MSNPLKPIPRTAVHGYLRAVRLPLDAAGRVLHRDGSTPWRPSVAFEAFEAKAKGLAGTVLRDEDLQEEARVQTARVDQLRKAATAAAAASAKEAVADRELDERRQSADQRRAAAEKAEKAEKEPKP